MDSVRLRPGRGCRRSLCAHRPAAAGRRGRDRGCRGARTRARVLHRGADHRHGRARLARRPSPDAIRLRRVGRHGRRRLRPARGPARREPASPQPGRVRGRHRGGSVRADDAPDGDGRRDLPVGPRRRLHPGRPGTVRARGGWRAARPGRRQARQGHQRAVRRLAAGRLRRHPVGHLPRRAGLRRQPEIHGRPAARTARGPPAGTRARATDGQGKSGARGQERAGPRGGAIA